MGRRKQSVLTRTDNLKKSKEENPTKRQKHDYQDREKRMQTALSPYFNARGVLHADHITPEHHFYEFQVNTGPDPNLLDDVEGLHGLLDIEESDDEEDDEEDDEQGWYSDMEEESFQIRSLLGRTNWRKMRWTHSRLCHSPQWGSSQLVPAGLFAYEQGLNGRQAAWAARKYRGHRVLPVSIMKKAGVV